MIGPFRGEYRFLSNFWPCRVEYEGVIYPSVEHAYQAAKTLDKSTRQRIGKAKTPGEAKRIGHRVPARPGWFWARPYVMRSLVEQKFRQDARLRQKLLDTGQEELIEWNTWHDQFWGRCACLACGEEGKNVLGEMLMDVRRCLAEQMEKEP